MGDQDPTTFKNQQKTLLEKMLHSSKSIQGLQLVSILVLLSLPEEVTNWDTDGNTKEKIKKKYREAWTKPPVWDKDKWYINYIGHPYSGSIYYNSLRSQGESKRNSFLYSTLQSFTYEYLIEAFAERPSIQDLLTTSPIGSLLGEICHRKTLKLGKDGFTKSEKLLTLLINPAYVINNKFKPTDSLQVLK